MKGWGTDENRIIEILGHRDVYQRIQIRDQYKASFGQDLIQRISGETSGGGTDEDTIIQVLCTSTNNEIMEIKEAYQSVLISYGINDPTRTLESDVEGDLSGCFKNLVIALLQAQREEADFEDVQKIPTRGLSSVVNMSQVEKDVDAIWNAGEGRIGTDESTFIKIVANRSVWHIQAIAKKFEEKYEKSLIDSLESETSGDFERALVLTVRSCLNRQKHTLIYYIKL
ncbi:unnamed protein product [Heterobilharzia americana]|nr:unnamed protein product [Heterobilharzia americana]